MNKNRIKIIGSETQTTNGHELAKQAAKRQEAVAEFVENEYTGIGERVAGYENKHRSWIQKWFTERGMAKLLEEQKLQETSSFHEYRREAMKLACETKLEIAHERCLRMVREAKVGDRQRFSSFVMAAQRELRSSVHAEREMFMESIDDQYDMLARFQHRPSAHANCLSSVEKEVEKYFTWVDGLMDWFMAISKEKVNQYRLAD